MNIHVVVSTQDFSRGTWHLPPTNLNRADRAIAGVAMEDAGRAIKRVREELAKKDKANGTSVSESLDLSLIHI